MYIPTDFVIGELFVVIIILTVWLMLVERRISRLLRGGKTSSIEETLKMLERDVRALSSFRKEVEAYLQTAEKRLKRSVQGVHTVRFQAFTAGGSGGKQSFASAFVSEKGDGVVISSIYSRDIVGIYAKPIENGISKYELTTEEKEALESARKESLK